MALPVVGHYRNIPHCVRHPRKPVQRHHRRYTQNCKCWELLFPIIYAAILKIVLPVNWPSRNRFYYTRPPLKHRNRHLKRTNRSKGTETMVDIRFWSPYWPPSWITSLGVKISLGNSDFRIQRGRISLETSVSKNISLLPLELFSRPFWKNFAYINAI